ncbi:MAG: NmrA/HSCARG family protein [Bryobacterales bacterium]
MAGKIIAVTGATGQQGAGLVRAILDDPDGGFAVRAVTRNPGSDKAKALADLGAEVVQAELDDQASIEKAFAGAYGAFCLTNYWEHFSPQKETTQAGNLARAAKVSGVQHAIWSTLEDTRKKVPLESDQMPTLMEHYKVPHLDAKGEADELFADLGVPTTWYLTSFYYDNFIYFGMGPKPGLDGKLAISLPMGHAKLAAIAAEDIGRCAYGIFKAGPKYIGKTVGVAGSHMTVAEMAQSFTKVLGQEVVYNEVTPEAYRGFGFPGADDLGNMFQYFRDFADEFCAARSLDESRALNPQLMTFDVWLAANKDRIPL